MYELDSPSITLQKATLNPPTTLLPCDLRHVSSVRDAIEGSIDLSLSTLVISELCVTYVPSRKQLFGLFPLATFICYELLTTGVYGGEYLRLFDARVKGVEPWRGRGEVVECFEGDVGERGR